MVREYSPAEWQQIIGEHVKHGCCTSTTLRALRSGRFPRFEHLPRKTLEDYLASEPGDALFQRILSEYEAQVQAKLEGLAASQRKDLESLSLFQLWEALSMQELRRALAGDRESARTAIQLLRVRARVPPPALAKAVPPQDEADGPLQKVLCESMARMPAAEGEVPQPEAAPAQNG